MKGPGGKEKSPEHEKKEHYRGGIKTCLVSINPSNPLKGVGIVKTMKWMKVGMLALLGAMNATVQAQAGTDPTPSAARQPFPVKDLQSAIAQTAAIVEGEVSDIQYDYSEENGPWTRVLLSNVKPHLGAAPKRIELRQFGGRLPDGRMVVAAELPAFVKGKHYIVFLRNTKWNLSPVVGDLALRVENVNGVEVLVNSDGQAVSGISSRGVEVGPTLFEGLELDGTPPQARPEKLLDFASQPLDRRGFMEALNASLGTKSLKITGTFSPHPAGEFKWRNQRTAQSTQHPASTNTLEHKSSKSAGPEIDTSEPQR